MKKVSYKKSGVDTKKADRFVKAIRSTVKGTKNPGVIERPGAFGGLFAIDKKIKNPVLVSSTDGVGTKLLIAQHLNQHDTVGIDCVAMNVNDILCVGARPLFFLDYLACGKLKPRVLKEVVKGIAKGCRQAGCSLIAGETAEMPGMYGEDEYDIAGFAVGALEKGKIIDGSKIRAGDVVIGLPSSGIHSNGYSLVRKVFPKAEQKKLGAELLKPTRIYVKDVLPLFERFRVKGMAHITGGAYYEKLTKILPKGLCFEIDTKSWPVPKIFQKIQKRGTIDTREMYRTFNMGIGFVIVVSSKDADSVSLHLKKRRVRAYTIGKVIKNPQKRLVLWTS